MKFEINNKIFIINKGQYWILNTYKPKCDSILEFAVIVENIEFLNKNLKCKSIIDDFECVFVKIVFNFLNDNKKYECTPYAVSVYLKPASEKEIEEINIIEIIS